MKKLLLIIPSSLVILVSLIYFSPLSWRLRAPRNYIECVQAGGSVGRFRHINSGGIECIYHGWLRNKFFSVPTSTYSENDDKVRTQTDQNYTNQCSRQPADPNGYLEKICQYLNMNNINASPANPAYYKIQSVTEGQYDNMEAIVVRLDCCYLGDVAYIDKQTKAVIGFKVGPK